MRHLVNLFLLLCLPLSLGGQSLPPLTKHPEAVALVEHILAANGHALGNNEGTLAGGTIQIAGISESNPIRIYARGNRFVRTEVDRPSGTSVYILHDGDASFQAHGERAIHMNRVNTIAERLLYLPEASLMSEFNDPEIELQYIGPAQLSGTTVVQFSAAWSSANQKKEQDLFLNRTRVVYSVDPSTYRILQIEYDRSAENDTNDLTHFRIVYSDYQPLGGRPIATTITTFANDKFFSEIRLKSFQDDVAVSSDMFSIPEVQK